MPFRWGVMKEGFAVGAGGGGGRVAFSCNIEYTGLWICNSSFVNRP